MKILLILTLYLISGLGSCFDVIGYPGGGVIITCTDDKYGGGEKIFCKLKTGFRECESAVVTQRGQFNTPVHKDRFSLYDDSGKALTATIRNLRSEDSGLYQCGEGGAWSHDINLVIKEDPCCLRPKTVIGYLGETTTISCSYPEEFQDHGKGLYKEKNLSFTPVIRTTDPSLYKFSISDSRSSRVFSVTMRDVREDDGGVYYCGGDVERKSISYESLYTAIHLHVKESRIDLSPTETIEHTSVTTSAPDKEQTAAVPDQPGMTLQPGFLIIVSISVVLLLIGGLTLILYKLRSSKTQGSTSTNLRRNDTADGDYENDLPRNQNISMSPVYDNLNPNSNQSDSVYQSLNPNTNQSDSLYQTLNPNLDQSDSVYQSLNPNTNQSDSVYHTLSPYANQLDPSTRA